MYTYKKRQNDCLALHVDLPRVLTVNKSFDDNMKLALMDKSYGRSAVSTANSRRMADNISLKWRR